jgi:hypothetical protein
MPQKGTAPTGRGTPGELPWGGPGLLANVTRPRPGKPGLPAVDPARKGAKGSGEDPGGRVIGRGMAGGPWVSSWLVPDYERFNCSNLTARY